MHRPLALVERPFQLFPHLVSCLHLVSSSCSTTLPLNCPSTSASSSPAVLLKRGSKQATNSLARVSRSHARAPIRPPARPTRHPRTQRTHAREITVNHYFTRLARPPPPCLPTMLPNSGGFQLPAMPSSVSSNSSNSSAAGGSAHSHQSAGPSTGKYACPNCGKCFARGESLRRGGRIWRSWHSLIQNPPYRTDDLLRRHLAREARAMAQPQFDRQKSCFECARSKARCDLEVPSVSGAQVATP